MGKDSEASGLAAVWPALVTLIGTGALVAGLVMSGGTGGQANLTPEMVQEFNSAGTALEEASAIKKKQREGKIIPADAAEGHQYETARSRFVAAREEMEQAKASGARLSFWLKVVGASLALVGAGALWVQRST